MTAVNSYVTDEDVARFVALMHRGEDVEIGVGIFPRGFFIWDEERGEHQRYETLVDLAWFLGGDLDSVKKLAQTLTFVHVFTDEVFAILEAAEA